MVEAGELSIKGTLDISDIERGARDANSKLNDIKEKGQSTNGSLSILSGTTGKLAANFLKIGTIGVGALAALSSKSPQLADEFARIGVETFKLSNTLGGVFEPIFQEFEEGFSGFTQAVSDNQSAIKDWVDFGLVVANGALSDLGTVMEKVKGLYGAFDEEIKERTGGTSFTEELITQTQDVKTNIEKQGLTGGLLREESQTFDAVLNLLLNSVNQVFGNNDKVFDTNIFEYGYDNTQKPRLYYNVDTTGD